MPLYLNSFMKQFKSLPILFSLIYFTSCQKDISLLQNDEFKLDKSATSNITNLNAVITPNFNWETTTNILLPDGTNRILPWFSSSITAIPSYILADYHKADGWELVYNLCNTPGQLGQNYFILYNKFTGTLRTFYFLSDNVTSGSNGMWGISLNGNNSMLNNAGYFAIPMDVRTTNPSFISSNITNESIAKTINRGWNAFDTEFTYDNSVSQPLNFYISTYNKNIQDVTLSGDLNLNSSGTIVTSSSKNSWSDASTSAAKSVGEGAKSYVDDKLEKKANGSAIIKIALPLATSIISGGVSDIINAGINLLFGSFIGKKSVPTSTTQKLEFKTQGTVSLNGTITGSEATNVSPVANLLVPGTDLSLVNNTIYPFYNKKLGVWNLKHAPKVFVSKTAYHVISDGLDNNVYVRSVDIDPSSIQVDLNPDVASEISSFTVTTNLYYYEKFNNSLTWNATSSSNLLHYNQNQLIYDDGKNIIYKDMHSEYLYGPYPVPQTDPNQDYEVPSMQTNFIDNKYVVKVTVTLYPKSGYNPDPIVITRSYKPNYELVD